MTVSCYHKIVNFEKPIIITVFADVVTLSKLNKNKMVSNYLVRCPGLFDVKILGWFDGLQLFGF